MSHCNQKTLLVNQKSQTQAYKGWQVIMEEQNSTDGAGEK